MSNDIKLGTTPGPDAQRDAIHIAIIPVIAGGPLNRGSAVTLNSNGHAIIALDNIGIGLIDPFRLEDEVETGSRVWLLLYQAAHTGLEATEDQLWMSRYAIELGYTYSHVMDAAKKYIDTDGRECLFGGDNLDCVDLDPSFWQHYKNITGRTGEGIMHSFFRCAC